MRRPLSHLAALTALLLAAAWPGAPAAAQAPPCDPDDGGLQLPPGFCAVKVASGLDRPRHMAVAPNGDLFVAILGRRGTPAGVLALRDLDGDGRPEVRNMVYEGAAGSGIALTPGYLYFAPHEGVLRFRREAASVAPLGAPDTIVWGLPGGGHDDKTLALGPDGGLFVNLGSRSNVCETGQRGRSPVDDPCRELETRAGIWRFDAALVGQRQADGERFATGLRNVVALEMHPLNGVLYGAQHGRDDLKAHGFSDAYNAENPSEELVEIRRGDDFGWPYCYHSGEEGHLVTAPEYGGDGTATDRCTGRKEPLVAFPGHWAPNDLLFYTGNQFPARFRGGAFLAFHGSWNRAPLPQAGYSVVFQPMADGRPTGPWETFVASFVGADGQPTGHRPTGLAQGPDGSLYVSDDGEGTIWRIFHTGR